MINGAEAIPSDTPDVVSVSTNHRTLRPEDRRDSIVPLPGTDQEYAIAAARGHDLGGGDEEIVRAFISRMLIRAALTL